MQFLKDGVEIVVVGPSLKLKNSKICIFTDISKKTKPTNLTNSLLKAWYQPKILSKHYIITFPLLIIIDD